MDRRRFFRTAPAVALTAVAKVQEQPRGGVHISIESDSPFFGGVLAQRGVKKVFLNGEPVRRCVEASEPDGFVLQSVTYLSNTAHLLREPGAELIPATDKHPARVKRYGVVRVEFREAIA